MGLTIYREMPSGQGELVRVIHLPITVEPNEAYALAKQKLDELLAKADSLEVTNDQEHDEAVELQKNVKRFLKDIEEGVDAPKRQLNTAKNQMMELINSLKIPAEKIMAVFAKKTGRYEYDREQARLREEARRREEAERERQRLQREADLSVLRLEIQTAEQEAKDAEMRDQLETAKEIRKELRRFAALDSAPGAFQQPLEDATRVRQVVLFAKQHEQGRIAAAKAAAEGNRTAARKIEQATAKLEAPRIEQVQSERIEAAPVVVPKADLFRSKGQHAAKKKMRFARFTNTELVPIRFRPCCEHCIALLNKEAQIMGDSISVPGVEFEEEVKTSGIRA